MSKPRIMFSNYDDRQNPAYGGGGAVAIHEVAKRLAAFFTVTVLTGTYPGAVPTEVIDGVTYRRIGWYFLGPKVSQLLFALSLPGYALTETFDLWVENMTPPLGPSLLPLFTRRPVIALVHMLPGMDMWRKYHIPFFLFERLGLKCYRDFIVLSKEMQATIARHHPWATFHIIPNGVVSPDITGEYAPRHILYLGRIEVDQKGLDLLIEAYQQLAQDTTYPLVIAGDGTVGEVEKLKKLIVASGCADRIQMVGRVEGDIKARLFQEAVMVVVPSRFESFGLVALEALAYGIPVVTFDIEGFKWLPADIAEKAAPFRVADLSERKLRVLAPHSTEGKAHRFAFAARYQWGAVTDAYRTVIERRLRGTAGPSETKYLSTEAEPMSVIIEDILKRRVPCFFVSPHLDDAILSAGALLTYLSEHTAVRVVTVFTEAGPARPTLSARQFLKQCGATDGETLFAERRAEDLAVLQSLSVPVTHLGLSDALWRPRRNISWWRKLAGKILPELLVLYPTYRFHITRGIIARGDASYAALLRDQLTALTAGLDEYYVFCPQAIGNHVDHVLVERTCQELFPNLIEWSDFPYNLKRAVHDTPGWSWENGLERKQQLILSYETQAEALFPGLTIPLIPESYALSKHTPTKKV